MKSIIRLANIDIPHQPKILHGNKHKKANWSCSNKTFICIFSSLHFTLFQI